MPNLSKGKSNEIFKLIFSFEDLDEEEEIVMVKMMTSA
jgi:hypothetical protein